MSQAVPGERLKNYRGCLSPKLMLKDGDLQVKILLAFSQCVLHDALNPPSNFPSGNTGWKLSRMDQGMPCYIDTYARRC